MTTLYSFGGIEQPINTDGSSSFKLGRTLPVKFDLTDVATGQPAGTAIATLEVAKVSDSVLGSYDEAVSTSMADDGNQFRYAGDGNYIFNLSTSPLSVGTYRLRINLNDGQSFTVDVSLR